MRISLILIILGISVFIALFLAPFGVYETDQLKKTSYSQAGLSKPVIVNQTQPVIDMKTQNPPQKGIAEQSLEFLDTMPVEEY